MSTKIPSISKPPRHHWHINKSQHHQLRIRLQLQDKSIMTNNKLQGYDDPISSAKKALVELQKLAKMPKWSPLWSRKMPMQVATKGVPNAAPSVLTFTQNRGRGLHKTSTQTRCLGGWTMTSKFFKMIKSCISLLEHLFMLLPSKSVRETMEAQPNFQWEDLFWNRALLRAFQIKEVVLTTTAMITTLYYKECLLPIIERQSSIEVIREDKPSNSLNHIQRQLTKMQSKIKCCKDSEQRRQRLHCEGSIQPLEEILSSMGSLSKTSFQSNRDFNGGIDEFQISLPREKL